VNYYFLINNLEISSYILSKMEEENYSDDENVLTKDLETLKTMIPREKYNENKEEYEQKMKQLEDTDEEEEAQEEDEDEDEDEEEEEEEEEEEKPEQTEILRTAFSEFNDEDDEEEDDDEFYLQKFDENTQKKIISDFHPELQSHNYDEIEVLSRVVRDENGNIS
jgi:hypothetical protein